MENSEYKDRIIEFLLQFLSFLKKSLSRVLIFSPPYDIIYSQIEFYDIENFEFDFCRYKTEIRWIVSGQVSQRMKAF